jgi:hypothetical protein
VDTLTRGAAKLAAAVALVVAVVVLVAQAQLPPAGNSPQAVPSEEVMPSGNIYAEGYLIKFQIWWPKSMARSSDVTAQYSIDGSDWVIVNPAVISAEKVQNNTTWSVWEVVVASKTKPTTVILKGSTLVGRALLNCTILVHSLGPEGAKVIDGDSKGPERPIVTCITPN